MYWQQVTDMNVYQRTRLGHNLISTTVSGNSLKGDHVRKVFTSNEFICIAIFSLFHFPPLFSFFTLFFLEVGVVGWMEE